MKQVTNSLLTLYPIRSTATRFATGFPRDEVCATGRLLTPFHVHREEKQLLCTILPGRSCPPRSFIHTRLGEGRIRSLLHKISYLLLAAVALFLSVSVLYGAEGVQILLKEKAHVASEKVLLKDIASFEGTNADLIEKIGNLTVADPLLFGEVKTFSRHQIKKIICRVQGAETEVRMSGPQIVQIRLQGRPARAGEIIPALRSFIVEATQWREQEIEILSIKNLDKIKMPAGESDLRISDKSPVFGRGKILVSFDVVRNGKILTDFWVTAKTRITAAILTAVKRIPYRKTITPDDVVAVTKEIEDLDAAFIRDTGEVIGKVSKRSFSPGDPLTLEFFTEPFLVKRGDTVNLRLERNGLVLTSLARAEQDGRLGQIIRVRNIEFSSVLKAKVTGCDQVEIP